MLDFDTTDIRRQPPIDTTWQQVTFSLVISFNELSDFYSHLHFCFGENESLVHLISEPNMNAKDVIIMFCGGEVTCFNDINEST